MRSLAVFTGYLAVLSLLIFAAVGLWIGTGS